MAMDVKDFYVKGAPSPQAIVNIFAGEWSSNFPESSGVKTTPGGADLFDDARITWLSEKISGFGGLRILELGPLEAGHTYMMHERGAKSITSVEANMRSYMKCLCTKEIFGLERAHFLLGEAIAYTAASTETFDLCVASGILYHMQSPVELLSHIAARSKRVFIWTHYYDEAHLRLLDEQFEQFEPLQSIEFQGRSYQASKREYGKALDWPGFCGGLDATANWLTRDSLIQALADCGLAKHEISFDQPDHPNGPAIALLASK
jgi:hypothetical protein